MAIVLVVGVVAFGGLAALLLTRSEPVAATAIVEGEAPQPTPDGGLEDADPARRAVSIDASRGGMAAYARGQVAASMQEFEAAVAADPQNADALNNLGQMLVRTGRAQDAIPYFNRAIAAASDVWAYHFNRARAYAELQVWNLAIAGYRDSARLFPGDYATSFNLAKALQANGNLDDAIVEFERAIALAPEQADFNLALAYALDKRGRAADATAAYRRFLDLQPDSPQAEKIHSRLARLAEPAS